MSFEVRGKGNFTKYMPLDRAQASVLAKLLVEMAHLQSCDLHVSHFMLFFKRNIWLSFKKKINIRNVVGLQASFVISLYSVTPLLYFFIIIIINNYYCLISVTVNVMASLFCYLNYTHRKKVSVKSEEISFLNKSLYK